MNVSTFTKGEKYKFIAMFSSFTFLLLFTRRFPFVAIAALPALGVALLIMRGRLLRHFAKTRVKQVAYVSLIEPIYDHYTITVGEDDYGNPITERRSRVVGHKKRDVPRVQKIDPCYVNLLRYIEEKKNPSVLTAGRPGMGKTELMKRLLFHQRVPKIILSFKPNDAYLQLPYQVVDISKHTPNPFQDADAFLMAYQLAFPVNMRGIMLSEAAALIKSLASRSSKWDEFRRNLKSAKRDATDIQMEALALIEGQIESLAIGEGTFRMDLNRDTVIDLSSLDEAAKTFYAEIILRQIWAALTTGPVSFAEYGKTNVRLIIAIDELHRLMQAYNEFGIKSVIETLLRMVRQFGAVYAATQNYTDTPDKLRNLFGTQFVFNTSSENDLEALGRIEPGYAWAARKLLPHHFIDATFKTDEREIFPVVEAEPVKLPEPETERNALEDLSQPPEPVIDYAAIVREKIDGGEVVWVSRLARLVAENHSNADKDAAKLKFRNILLKLLDAGEVQVQRLDDPESGETVSLYFAKSISENEGPLHKWMLGQAVEGRKEDIIHVASTGEALPDVETNTTYLEVETGLKRRIDDLQERIARFGKNKPFAIIVPNSDIKETYRKLERDRVTVRTLREFLADEP